MQRFVTSPGADLGQHCSTAVDARICSISIYFSFSKAKAGLMMKGYLRELKPLPINRCVLDVDCAAQRACDLTLDSL